MEALADVGVLASWSPLHKQVEVIDYYPDGRPHHVRATVKILGLVDKEVLEYHWGLTGCAGMPIRPSSNMDSTSSTP